MIPDCFLLSRLLLRFDRHVEDLIGEVSAIAHTPDGSLWIGSDELTSIERLSPIEPYVYGNHQSFELKDFISLFDDEEVDIEGLDFANGYLWLTGSHSMKRKKPKGKGTKKDIERLSTIGTDLNRFILARIPVIDGNLVKVTSHPDNPDIKLTSACLQTVNERNVLIEALAQDEHLGPFIQAQIPSKDNGLDIEGLAAFENKVFLGLRGPVLRGWAIILELELEEIEPGVLTLKPIGKSEQIYKKHFVHLNGLGIRELCLLDKDVVILAGPTMALEGEMRLFCLKNIVEIKENSIFGQDSDELEVLFDLPFTIGNDHAEGLALFPCLDQPNSLLVVYDSPNPNRRVQPNAVYADIFRLKA